MWTDSTFKQWFTEEKQRKWKYEGCLKYEFLVLLQIRIWARKEAVKNGYVDYALNITGPIFSFLEDLLNINYPLPKTGEFTCFLKWTRNGCWWYDIHRSNRFFCSILFSQPTYIHGIKSVRFFFYLILLSAQCLLLICNSAFLPWRPTLLKHHFLIKRLRSG